MSFRPDSSVELPSGGLVCNAHHLRICGICTVDYNFMDDMTDHADEPVSGLESSQGPAAIINPNLDGPPPGPTAESGRFFPTPFKPPQTTDTPQSLFVPGMNYKATPPVHRFINRTDSSQFLIYTDGACLNNGQVNPRAGCSFVFKPASTHEVVAHVAMRLEKKGPTGERHPQTSNRAELRAALAALRFRFWPGEGFDTLVIATDSAYMVNGATSWIRGWARNGWKTSAGASVKNRDLWECLIDEAERFHHYGMKVRFWRIPRECNTQADRRAKEAAAEPEREEYREMLGALV
ncbi:uncharacterized protein APUU_80483A [Aspergillus puulaauensis]|uniref:ribonuclease H n=1 Tax=Aspergillus puulaauensis TaxID=1220207 RepID=A0A7R7XYQ9_9EURO|nr:uncharacterized protein APUU_80483A [Aspergillus puulaauensis]BCS30180.1 hypothetical protein APUU_80483A [Aspergillus puulaauensis]